MSGAAAEAGDVPEEKGKRVRTRSSSFFTLRGRRKLKKEFAEDGHDNEKEKEKKAKRPKKNPEEKVADGMEDETEVRERSMSSPEVSAAMDSSKKSKTSREEKKKEAAAKKKEKKEEEKKKKEEKEKKKRKEKERKKRKEKKPKRTRSERSTLSEVDHKPHQNGEMTSVSLASSVALSSYLFILLCLFLFHKHFFSVLIINFPFWVCNRKRRGLEKKKKRKKRYDRPRRKEKQQRKKKSTERRKRNNLRK